MPKRDNIITRSVEAKHNGEFFEAKKIQAETRKAIGLPHREDSDPIWLPKSQIHAVRGEDDRIYLYVPHWLVQKKPLEMLKKY